MPVSVSQSVYGHVNGQEVLKFTLDNGDVEIDIITYGGIISSLRVPDNKGNKENIVLGFDTLQDYVEKNAPYFGAIIGRVANRIAGSSFELDEITYPLAKNNGENHLHGGLQGFDKKVWAAQTVENGIQLKYTSEDGEEGYPGTLAVTVTYTLDANSTLTIRYHATTNKKTLVNLTNHSYFNLAGAGNGDILGHLLHMKSNEYTPSRQDLIPTGQIASVKDTPFDFTTERPVGAANDQVPNGYDINFMVDRSGVQASALALAATVREPTTGRKLTVHTTEPGCQFYVGGFLDGLKGQDGKTYNQYAGFCLETQKPADAIHHPNFPSIILEPGQVLDSTTTFTFERE
eukprot:m.96859 g.96859  ORF g.96859 m.96859 type:complete len:346 (-) comp14809_c0_seq3:221-1258(-)